MKVIMLILFVLFIFYKKCNSNVNQIHVLYDKDYSLNRSDFSKSSIMKYKDDFYVVYNRNYKDTLGLKTITKNSISFNELEKIKITKLDSLLLFFEKTPYKPNSQLFVIEKRRDGKIILSEVLPYEIVVDKF